MIVCSRIRSRQLAYGIFYKNQHIGLVYMNCKLVLQMQFTDVHEPQNSSPIDLKHIERSVVSFDRCRTCAVKWVHCKLGKRYDTRDTNNLRFFCIYINKWFLHTHKTSATIGMRSSLYIALLRKNTYCSVCVGGVACFVFLYKLPPSEFSQLIKDFDEYISWGRGINYSSKYSSVVMLRSKTSLNCKMKKILMKE